MSRPIEAQLTTARMLLAQFIVQIEEHDELEAAGTLQATDRGRDLASRIDGLRQGHTTWTQRVTDLEAQLQPEQETP